VNVAVSSETVPIARPVLSKIIVATEPAGRDTKTPRNVASSAASSDAVVIDTEDASAEPMRPFAGVAIATAVTSAASPSPALAGATEESSPKPKAATATSATRLKVVFVDICFLSISRSEEFPPVGFG
jgi:hypothetical protein